jgi:hypothetical protein
MPNAQIVRLVAVALFVAMIFAAAIASGVTDRPYLEYLQSVFLAVFTLMLVRKLVRWLRYVRGRVSLDLGPNPMRRSLRLISVITICAVFFLFMDIVTSDGSLGSNMLGMATLVLIAISAFSAAFERFQLVESGIWCFGDLKQWEKIAGYSWIPDSKVVLRMRGDLDKFKGHAIAIPQEHREAVESALRSHGILNAAE